MVRPGGLDARRDLRAVPQPARSGCAARAPSSPAASSRCWRSGASCAPARACSCSTSRPRGWRRSSSSRSARTIRRLKAEGFTILLVEQNFRFAATVADRHYVDGARPRRRHDRATPSSTAQHGEAARVPRGIVAPRILTHERSRHMRIDASRRRSRRSLAAGGRARPPPQISDGIIKIGVLNDQSSLYADLAGQGSVVAARMAVEDFGAAEKGLKVEIIFADHQNKADVGSQIARQWYDADKVDVIVDVPNSGVALAVNQITRDKNKAFLVSSAALVRPHRQGLLAQHRALDLRHLGARQRHRQRGREDRRRHLVLPHRRLRLRPRARARRRGGGAEERRQGAGQGAPSAQHRRTSPRSCCRRRPPRPRSSASPTPAATPPTPSSRARSSASCKGGQNFAGLLVFLTDVHALGLREGAGPDLHRDVLLGHERPDARLRQALRRAQPRHPSRR